jgi:hypothetical protein
VGAGAPFEVRGSTGNVGCRVVGLSRRFALRPALSRWGTPPPPATSEEVARPDLSSVAFEDASHIARLVTERLPQGSSKTAPPSTYPSGACSDGVASAGPGRCRVRTRSDFVVSRHLAGLRHPRGRGLVASRCRPWGSSGFGFGAHAVSRGFRPSPPTFRPPELFLPRQPTSASPRRRAPLPFTTLRWLDSEALIHRGVRGCTPPWPAT